MVDNLGGAARERVGRRLSEDVAHVGAGRDHELTATHPDLWGNLRTKRSPLQLTRITRQVVLWPRSGPAMANQLKNKPAIQSAQFLTKEHTLSIDRPKDPIYHGARLAIRRTCFAKFFSLLMTGVN